MRYLFTAIFWAFFWLYTMVLFIELSFIHLFSILLKKPATLSEHRLAARWGEGILKHNPAWSYTISGREYIPREGDKPVVVVANHQSSMDIAAVMAMGFQFRWLSKSAVFKIPLIGHAMKWAGYVPVKRGCKESQQQALDDSAAWIRKGISMVYFPEGTRSLTGKLRTFKTGAFRIAEAENVKILPVIIQGTRNMMAIDSYHPQKASVQIKILKPVRKNENESMEEYAQRVRSMISQHVLVTDNAPHENTTNIVLTNPEAREKA